MKWKKIIGILAVVAAAAFFLTACSSKSSSKNELKIGVMTLDDSSKPIWDQVKKDMAKKGVTIKLVQFSDYNQPNKALQSGDVDVNAFQHHYFLDNWNKKAKSNLVVVGDTYISPIRFFSKAKSNGKPEYADVKDLPEGAKVLVPNDATNESRSLFLLQSAGLIKLSTKEGGLATLKDVTENPKDLDFKEVDASQTAREVKSGDVDAAVVNNSFVQSAKISYATAIYKEDVSGSNAKQWYNVIAAKSDWKKSKKADAIKTLLKVYQTDKTAKTINKATKGVDQAVWKGAPEFKSAK